MKETQHILDLKLNRILKQIIVDYVIINIKNENSLNYLNRCDRFDVLIVLKLNKIEEFKASFPKATKIQSIWTRFEYTMLSLIDNCSANTLRKHNKKLKRSFFKVYTQDEFNPVSLLLNVFFDCIPKMRERFGFLTNFTNFKVVN